MKFLRLIVPWLLVIVIILAALYLPDLGPEIIKISIIILQTNGFVSGDRGYEVAIIKDGDNRLQRGLWL